MRVSVSVTIILLLVGNGLFSQDCPEKIAEFDGYDHPYYAKLTVEDDYLYISQMPESGMISIFDISSPENPVLVSEFYTNDCTPTRLIVQNKILYFPESCACPAIAGLVCNGWVAWDLSNPYSPVKLFHYLANSDVHNIAVKDNLAFLSVGGYRIEVLKMNHPDPPTTISSIVPCGDLSMGHIVISDEQVAIISCDGYRVIVVDIHDPVNPVIVSELFPVEGMYLTDMEARGNLLYISGPDFGLAIFEIQKDYSLTELGRWNNYMGLREITIAGELLVSRYYDRCQDEQALSVLNVSNPAAIEEVGNWVQSDDWGYFQDVLAATRSTVIMGDEHSEDDLSTLKIHVFDVSGCHSRFHPASVNAVFKP